MTPCWPFLVALFVVGCSRNDPVDQTDPDLPFVQGAARISVPTTLTISNDAIPGSSVEVEGTFGYPQIVQLSNAGLLSPGPTSLTRRRSLGGVSELVGRAGAGPLEFRQITATCRTRGDTLVVWDSGLHRVTILDGQQRLVNTFLLPASFVGPNACLDDGTFISQHITAVARGEARWLEIEQHDLREGQVRLIGRVPVSPFDVEIFSEPMVLAVRNRVVVATGSRSEVLVVPLDGTPRFYLKTMDSIVPVSREDREKQHARLTAANKTSRRAGAMPPLSGTKRDAWPSIGGLSIGHDLTLWIRDYPRSANTPIRWVGYRLDGRSAGAVVASSTIGSGSDLEILRFVSHDTVVVLRAESDGARFVELRRLNAIAVP
jgi:hypothetical protein